MVAIVGMLLNLLLYSLDAEVVMDDLIDAIVKVTDNTQPIQPSYDIYTIAWYNSLLHSGPAKQHGRPLPLVQLERAGDGHGDLYPAHCPAK